MLCPFCFNKKQGKTKVMKRNQIAALREAETPIGFMPSITGSSGIQCYTYKCEIIHEKRMLHDTGRSQNT